jgi:ABC-type long-subunit fatty acid transport system fused permease/ATPase subunit
VIEEGFDPIGIGGVSPYYLGMPLLNVVITLVVVGVILWLINTYIPMQATIKKILNIVVVIVVILWLLYGFGIISGGGDINMPRVN